MADNGVNVPSVSDLLPDEGQSLPQVKKICTGETSSAARPASEPITDPAADPEAAPDLTLNGFESSAAPALVLAGPLVRLSRNRAVVGEVVRNLFESSPGEVLRLPCRSYARLVFQLPTRDDARGFRGAFPMTFHYNGGAVELKLYNDPEPDFTTARAWGETHLIIRNVPFGYTVSAIRQLLTSSHTQDERKWLFDVRGFHKAYDPYEEISQPQMMGLPVAEINNPFFENIPAVLWLEGAQLPMIINLSCHSNNHRTCDHQWFAATRRKNLPNRYTITIAQLQNVTGMQLGALALFPTRSVPHLPMSLPVFYASHASLTFLSYCPVMHFFRIAALDYVLTGSGPLHLFIKLAQQISCSSPALSPTVDSGWASSVKPAKLLGQTPVPLAVKADLGILYIASKDDVELWTCAICDFECGPALDSAFTHIRSPGHGLQLMQTENQPTALETLGPLKAHDLRQRKEITSFLASLM
ncbi:unnamed protein product [Closterium sp. NIES-64]|nr:unnamed protein product [Closterium sp. NIES-64]